MDRARPGRNQKPNVSRRLAMAARKLISVALHRREAIAAMGDYFPRKDAA
jgi:hypothetical protein